MKLRKVTTQVPGIPVKFEVPGGLYTLDELAGLLAEAEEQSNRYEVRELQGYANPFGVWDIFARHWVVPEAGHYDMSYAIAFRLAKSLNEGKEDHA